MNELQQMTDEQVTSAVLQYTIQREIVSSNITQLVSEILRREQEKNKKPSPTELKLPALKRINLPVSHQI